MKKGYKLFVVRTYVRARNAPEAIRLVRKQEPDDVYVDQDWKEKKNQTLAEAIGFEVDSKEEEEEEV